MNQRENLLKKLSAEQLALWDTDLFLDTHPENQMALNARRGYAENTSTLIQEYTERFGMLTHASPESGDRWQWICDPWPWDND